MSKRKVKYDGVPAVIERGVRDELARKWPELSVNNALRKLLRMPLRVSRGRPRKKSLQRGKDKV